MNKKHRRIARTERIVARRKKVLRWSKLLLDDEKSAQQRGKQVGRCRDRHPFDCGRTRCGICSKKRDALGETKQEKASRLKQQED